MLSLTELEGSHDNQPVIVVNKRMTFGDPSLHPEHPWVTDATSVTHPSDSALPGRLARRALLSHVVFLSRLAGLALITTLIGLVQFPVLVLLTGLVLAGLATLALIVALSAR